MENVPAPRSKVESASSRNRSGALARSTSARIAVRALGVWLAPSARTAERCTLSELSVRITVSSIGTTSSPLLPR